MEFAQSKTVLRDNYVSAGLELVEEQDNRLILKYDDSLFVVTEEDIQEYADNQALRVAASTMPFECALTSPNYREQIVQPLDPIRWRHLPPLEMGFVFGSPDDDDTHVTIGAPSADFLNYFRFEPAYLKICLERMEKAPVTDDPIDIRQAFYKLPTIKVFNVGGKSVEDALEESSRIIEYCLFELAYLKNLPVGVSEEWPARRRLGGDTFVYEDDFDGTSLPMPSVDFNPDVVQFYQLGVSSRVPVLQFWSFYQVLEHYFVRTSDEGLHTQLANRLKDPRFKPSAAQLDRLVQDVVDHVDSIGEVSMLESVLKKYVDPEKLIDFIQQYEVFLDEPHYTKRRRVFGDDVEVKLDKDSVVENVARTIHAIRDTLMYSSDRFSRTARNVTFDRVSEMVKLEVPLMKFLAERVIIGTSS